MTQARQTARQVCRWHPQPDAATLERAVAAEILAAADRAIGQRGAFHLVLSGGNTPRRIHELLRASDAQWPRWHIWFGDERCLPPDDPERNSRMAAETLLDHVAIPRAQIHPIRGELGAAEAAADYARELAAVAGMEFDLVLLGLGEDGHTASLFPGHDWGVADEAPDARDAHDASAVPVPDALAVFNSPKPPPERVSLSARRLARARQVIFMVSGAGKRPALDAWRAGAAIPASVIAPAGGVDVYTA